MFKMIWERVRPGGNGTRQTRAKAVVQISARRCTSFPVPVAYTARPYRLHTAFPDPSVLRCRYATTTRGTATPNTNTTSPPSHDRTDGALSAAVCTQVDTHTVRRGPHRPNGDGRGARRTITATRGYGLPR